MIREEKIGPTGRARRFATDETPARYHQTIGSTRRGCTRACRTTIGLFGGREARWMGFTLNAGTSRLLPNGNVQVKQDGSFLVTSNAQMSTILYHLTNDSSFPPL